VTARWCTFFLRERRKGDTGYYGKGALIPMEWKTVAKDPTGLKEQSGETEGLG